MSDRAVSSHRAALSSLAGLACTAGVCTLILFSCAREIAGVASVTAVPNGTSLDLSWGAVSGVSQYDIFLSSSSDVSASSYTSEFTSNTSSLTITGLTAGSTYYIVVVPTALGGLAMGPSSSVVAVDITGTSSTPAPVITALSVSPDPAPIGQAVLFACSASDSSGATLSYTWTIDGATPTPTPNPAYAQYYWTASGTAGTTHTLAVTVSNGTTSASATTQFTLQ